MKTNKNLFCCLILALCLILSACSIANPDSRRLDKLDEAISVSHFNTAEKLIASLEKSTNEETIKRLNAAKEKIKKKKAEQAAAEEAIRQEMKRQQAEYDAFEKDFNAVASQHDTYHFLFQKCDVKDYYSRIALYVNDGWNLLLEEDKIDFAARMMMLYKGMLGARDLYKPNMKINFEIIDENSNTLLAKGDTKSNTISVLK